MASLVLTDVDIWLNHAGLTGVTNQFELTQEVEPNDISAFGSSWRTRQKGARTGSWSASGFWDPTVVFAESPDEIMFDAIDSPPTVEAMTVTPSGTAGETAYLWVPRATSYSPGGQFGAAAKYDLAGDIDGRVYKGGTTFDVETITGNTNGTEVQLSGGVASGETVAMAVHVLIDAGTSCDVVLQSDDNAGFTSATSQATASVSGTTWTYIKTVAGPITDDYWRARVTNVVGTSFTLGVSIGRAAT